MSRLCADPAAQVTATLRAYERRRRELLKEVVESILAYDGQIARQKGERSDIVSYSIEQGQLVTLAPDVAPGLAKQLTALADLRSGLESKALEIIAR